ncbi:MAG: DUF1937 family protein [Minisyncoccia bacterium]|jgi:hypothetical protein
MKIVFIAGPYYGGGDLRNIDKNIREAESFAIALANRGVGFFGPHLHTARFELRTTAPEEFYKELDMQMLQRASDAMVVIPGWEKSSGTLAEIEWAEANHKKIFYPKSISDLDEIVAWAKG